MVGNKSDNYEFETVEEIEAKSLAKKLNGIFHLTSAKNGNGVEELFKEIGRRFNNPDITMMSKTIIQEISAYDNKVKNKIKLTNDKVEPKKKRKFC